MRGKEIFKWISIFSPRKYSSQRLSLSVSAHGESRVYTSSLVDDKFGAYDHPSVIDPFSPYEIEYN